MTRRSTTHEPARRPSAGAPVSHQVCAPDRAADRARHESAGGGAPLQRVPPRPIQQPVSRHDARRWPGAARLGAGMLLLAASACGAEEPLKIELGDAPPLAGTSAADEQRPVDPQAMAKEGGPLIGVVDFSVSIYERPDRRSDKIGYLRVGAKVPRGETPVAYDSCNGGFYNVLPKGYVCLDDGASIDMDHPLLRAEIRQPDRSHPLPYSYAFVRAVAPRYYRAPTVKEQFESEMSLKRHLRSYDRLQDKWNAIEVGSNDVRLDEAGVVLGPPPLDPAKYGANPGSSGEIPWFFKDRRQIPNISNFKVPDYAVRTNRVKRHAGVALVDAFHGDGRDFAITTDLRLVPTSKLKPGRGSTFHGVELEEGWELPVAFVRRDNAYDYERRKGAYKRRKKRYAYGLPIQLTGEVRRKGKQRFVETEDGQWMRSRDLAIVAKSSKYPSFSKGETKWIDVSIQRQTLTLFRGRTPVYATMVSTGKDGLGDPRKSHSTPRGVFRIRDKHVTATMDSQVVGGEFELNDVPWVQYFKAGFALHASYWHTDYGRPRSHGCINLAPVDAMRIFHWTGPHLPQRWHSVSAGESTGKGTIINVHP